jgi:hypothetical protein
MREAAVLGLPLNAAPGRSKPALDWAAQRIARIRHARSLLRDAARNGARVVVVVRDPIARSLSLCFHAHRSRIAGAQEDDALRALLRSYDEHFWLWNDATPWEATALIGGATFDGSRPSWYERELAPALGVDLIKPGLDLRRGFVITEAGSIGVLILKTERLGDVLQSALYRFLGLEIAAVPFSNRAVGRLYERFTSGVSISAERLDRVLGSRSATALFRDDEREALRERWLARSGVVSSPTATAASKSPAPDRRRG